MDKLQEDQHNEIQRLIYEIDELNSRYENETKVLKELEKSRSNVS